MRHSKVLNIISDELIGDTFYQMVTCTGNNSLSNEKYSFKFNELSCKKAVRANVYNFGHSCAEGKGDILQIGFNVSSFVWYPLVEVCFNSKESVTYYSSHSISGLGLLSTEVSV